jgi:tetratricopeptide (TPR) repeat protein
VATLIASKNSQVIAAARANDAKGHYAASLALVERALAATPHDPELLLAQASTLFAWRRCREARASCLRAEALGLHSKKLYLHLGWSCFAIGNIEEAEMAMRKAVAIEPDAWESHSNLAVVLQAQKHLEQAAASYQRALESHPDDFDCRIGLGNCLLSQGDAAAAETQFRQAIALDDQRAIGWVHLGMAIVQQQRYADALETFVRADRLDEQNQEHAGSFVHLAIALAEEGRWREAHALYQARLPGQPSVEGHYAYALSLLTAGYFLEGWQHYEFRWLRESVPSVRRELRCPTWAGQELTGKAILLHVEQGFGDFIQFARYIPRVKASGATVILRVSRPLKDLARCFAGIDRILERDDVLPEFDFCIYMASLPRVFGTDLASIPADIPYLRSEPERSARWAQRLGARDTLRVGLAWAGNPQHPNDRYRSMKLGALSPLWKVAGVRYVLLQKGPAAAEAEGLPVGLDVANLGPELEDFSDTAALISELDLVLCVDTVVAHLAGALGKPVWLMLPRPADFRWMEEREDSPWYPTLRLFRQSRRDDWTDVLERVKAALEERVREGQPVMAAKTGARAATTVPLPWTSPSQLNVGHRPGMSAVAETRMGILQYLPDQPFLGDGLGWYGEYLEAQLDLLARIVRPGSTILEVGAGVGAHAVFLGGLLGEAGHLFLYESRPVLQRILRQNLAVNGVANVTVMRRMLGSRSEEEGTDGTAPPTTETLDELQLERLDCLKVGATASALDVLAGASETLWRLRPLLFLAAEDDQGLRELTERAREFGYRCWRMETALFDPQNFNQRETDIFGGAKALALLAIPEEIDVDIAFNECIEIS